MIDRNNGEDDSLGFTFESRYTLTLGTCTHEWRDGEERHDDRDGEMLKQSADMYHPWTYRDNTIQFETKKEHTRSCPDEE